MCIVEACHSKPLCKAQPASLGSARQASKELAKKGDKNKVIDLSLSVAIITFNEERIIEQTLSAISSLANQIIVVDSFSTDKTIDIAKKFNVDLFQRKWEGFSSQKNYAISKCKSDWILSLDADEITTSSLKDEITEAIKESKVSGYKIKRKLFIGKKWIKHGGYYPDYQLRLFKKDSGAYFNDRAVHESVRLKGEVGCLTNPLEHYAYLDLVDYENNMKKYAELASEEINPDKLYIPAIRKLWAFGYRYLFRLGFLEGSEGLQMARIYSDYVYSKYKLAEGKNV